MPVFKFPDSKPHDVKVSVGDDVTIQCDPYAIPDASVVWYKNGVALDRKYTEMMALLVCCPMPLDLSCNCTFLPVQSKRK